MKNKIIHKTHIEKSSPWNHFLARGNFEENVPGEKKVYTLLMGRGRRQSNIADHDPREEFQKASGDDLQDSRKINRRGIRGLITSRAERALLRFGWTEKDVYSMLPNLEDLQFSLHITSPEPGAIQIKALIENKDGELKGSFRRVLDLEERVAYHNSLQINEDVRGQGIGIRTFAAALEVYRKRGILSVELYANSEVGGYFWARVGFQPSTPEAALVVRKRTERAIGDLRQLEFTLEGDAQRELSVDIAYLESLLAEKPFPVNRLASFRPRGEHLLTSLKRMLREGLLSDSLSETAKALVDGSISGKNLLLGSGWSGSFRLGDKTSEGILQQYLRGLEVE